MDFLRPSCADRMRPLEPPTVREVLPKAVAADIDLLALIRADRSCCCLVGPAVTTVIPPARGRQHHTDLLLRIHHYWAVSRGLTAAGAPVVDTSGAVIEHRPACQATWRRRRAQ